MNEAQWRRPRPTRTHAQPRGRRRSAQAVFAGPLSQAQRDALVLRSLGLVWAVVREHYGHFAPEQQGELYHFGVVGLVKAARDFEPGRGVRFGTMAYPYVRNAVAHGVRAGFGRVHIPHRRRRDYAHLIYDEDGEAALMRIAPCERAALCGLQAGVLLLENADAGIGLYDRAIELADLRMDLSEAMRCLTDAESYVVIEHVVNRTTLRELGAVMGMSYEGVRKVELRALKKLRQEMTEPRGKRR
ncbi:sigma-70 family RNA polymerase sigma factor [Beduinella massiliensis]|uniref:sigma-70 family RNA polymerase sigma factor n=1 Tax=Beduinella massiliensis TaxID=1852363 RepID=UPI0031F794D4